ncbi:thioesterase family protein [Glaciecola sp. MH2013]|uniref:acyl-CoA thioesterase n=1 Tax=Glaciecola sp. MH2013 TaxID=2785524 RepID=UPI00189E9938|nr:thioesterase family protein [Glaciecola sp. MH2013]MBF7072953.1 thioesterase family protein [Glaciecola sp. MH2013]
MNIDDLIDASANHKQDPDASFIASSQWAQGRTVYGGLSAAMLYAAARPYVASDRVMRANSINFVGPLLSDAPFQITIEIVREGKNVSQIMARALQNGKTCVVSQICFGLGRHSKVKVESDDTHDMPLPKKGKFIPQIPKVTPKFLKNIDLAIISGGIPFTGRKTSHYHGWMRLKQAPKAISDAHIISLIDAWPPTLLQMMKWPAPASTVSWNLEFIHPHRKIEPTDWFAYKSETRQAADGYGHTEANIWDAHGELIAISRQTVAIFD